MDSVRSLARSLKILDLLIEADADPVLRGRGVSVQGIAAEIGVHKTTALRLLNTMVEARYAARSPNGGRGYVVGPAIHRVDELPRSIQRLKQVARPFLEELVAATGECAHLAVADGGRVLVIDDVETDQPLRVVPGSARHVALHSTSAGKCLLAYGLAEIPALLQRRTERTISDPEVLAREIAEVRAQGFALDDEENDRYARCISAPVFEVDVAVACIGVDAPSVRLADDRLTDAIRLVVETAGRMSSALGHRVVLEPAPSAPSVPVLTA